MGLSRLWVPDHRKEGHREGAAFQGEAFPASFPHPAAVLGRSPCFSTACRGPEPLAARLWPSALLEAPRCFLEREQCSCSNIVSALGLGSS